jgi:hypothetical protein
MAYPDQTNFDVAIMHPFRLRRSIAPSGITLSASATGLPDVNLQSATVTHITVYGFRFRLAAYAANLSIAAYRAYTTSNTILEISDSVLVHHCSKCGSVDEVPTGSLVVGVPSSPFVVALPLCGECGGHTFLQGQSPLPTNAAFYNSDQHAAVNGLVDLLAAKGRFASTVSAAERKIVGNLKNEAPRRARALASKRVKILSELEEFGGTSVLAEGTIPE